ncbi:MAG: hypothetical protein HQ589_03565 [Syntrophaceae bacterium]|nr:hypothetical protein [Syntrophaceae bacterium]
MENVGERKDTPIDVNIGGSSLGDLLDLAERIANQTEDEEGKQRVATIREALGDSAGEEEGEGTDPVVDSGLKFGGLFGGDKEGFGIGRGSLFGGGEGKDAGGGFFGGIFGLIEKIQQMQDGGTGEDGTQEFTAPGGGKAVFHVETGGGRSTVKERMRNDDSGSSVEPTVVRSGDASTEVVERPSETPEEVSFAMQVFDMDTEVQVCGSISGVIDPGQVACKVIEGASQLQICVDGHVHTVDLPAQVDAVDTTANFSNGVFSVTLKKVEEEPS